MAKILLYFDTVSPWSKVAFERLPGLAKLWGAELSYQPINLGYVMKYSGNRPPVSVPNKGKWMFADMKRASKFFDVTLQTPSNFPVNTMNAQAVLRKIQDTSPLPHFLKATSAVFDAVWGANKKDVATKEDLISILSPLNIWSTSDLETLVSSALEKGYRTKLQLEAEALVQDPGVFGMPWMTVTREDGEKEQFFGSDRFEQMACFLGKTYKGPFGDAREIKL